MVVKGIVLEVFDFQHLVLIPNFWNAERCLYSLQSHERAIVW
jgi:hypothetical protein